MSDKGYFLPKLQIFKFVWLGNDEASNCEAGSEVDVSYSLLSGRFIIYKLGGW